MVTDHQVPPDWWECQIRGEVEEAQHIGHTVSPDQGRSGGCGGAGAEVRSGGGRVGGDRVRGQGCASCVRD